MGWEELIKMSDQQRREIIDDNANTFYCTGSSPYRFESMILIVGPENSHDPHKVLPKFCCLCGSRLIMQRDAENGHLYCPQAYDPVEDSPPENPCLFPSITVYGVTERLE